jgi:hypothetical protein
VPPQEIAELRKGIEEAEKEAGSLENVLAQ